MSRILLLLENRENCRLLREWLTAHYEIALLENGSLSEIACDLCIVDGPTLERVRVPIQQRKTAESPLLWPLLLITHRRDVGMTTSQLWQSVDEMIVAPIEKAELQARVEVLLRLRQLSQELRLRNRDLETFIHAMTHDLRTPLQAILSYAQFLEEDAKSLTEQEHLYLSRIQTATVTMGEMLTSLLDFCRLGRAGFDMQSVSLEEVLETIMSVLQEEIRTRNGCVTLEKPFPQVLADKTLLRTTLTNLILNALKYVAPDTPPQVTVSATLIQNMCRISVQDNGLGVAKEDQQRIFVPFVRLQRSAQYTGTGLGLPSVRKAVEMMGGQIGIESAPGKGSIFRVDLPKALEAGDSSA
jgi:signal transduction histidine kinase